MPYLFRIIMQTQLVPQQFSNYTIDEIYWTTCNGICYVTNLIFRVITEKETGKCKFMSLHVLIADCRRQNHRSGSTCKPAVTTECGKSNLHFTRISSACSCTGKTSGGQEFHRGPVQIISKSKSQKEIT